MTRRLDIDPLYPDDDAPGNAAAGCAWGLLYTLIGGALVAVAWMVWAALAK